MNFKSHMLAGAGLAVLTLSPVAAWAQTTAAANTQVDEVIVTATKTGATNLQKTAIAMSVVSGDELTNQQATSLRDISEHIPALKIIVSGGNANIFIRGVGGFNAGELDVSVYTDGVYVSRNTLLLAANFVDIANLEVVKGPQGILFGRNSTGGAINFVSQTPSDSFHIKNVLSVGNYGLFDDGFAISGPLIPGKLQASLAANRSLRDAYQTNIVPGKPDPGNVDRSALKAQLRWEVTDNITDTLRADYIYADEIPVSNSTLLAAAPYSTLANTILGDYSKVAVDGFNRDAEQGYGIANELNWKLSDHLTLKSLSAYRSVKSKTARDGDATDAPVSQSATFTYQDQISQEFNLLNDFGVLSGVVGAYYFIEDFHTLSGLISPAFGTYRALSAAATISQDSKTPTISSALFAQETWHVTPRLGLTLGARYTAEIKKFSTFIERRHYTPGVAGDQALFPGFPFIHDFRSKANKLTPKFGIDFQFNDDVLLYASATQGYKSGGYNIGASSLVGVQFGPETIWAYEAGAKTEWFDRRLRLNVAAFRYDWKGLQFNAQIGPGISATTNAARASVNGLDIDLDARPVEDLTISAAATYLDSSYDDFKGQTVATGLRPYLAGNPRFTPATGAFDASGDTLINAPRLSLSASAQKDFDFAGGRGFIRGEYSYTAKTFFDPSNVAIASRPAFSLINASVGFTPRDSNWQISVWGKNLADKDYINFVVASTFPTASLGGPRTVGIRLVYSR